MRTAGVSIAYPDINNSEFTFSPDEKNNTILYGIKGITKVNADYAKAIIKNRPYSSLNDFRTKVKSTKLQILNLIKAGAFNKVEPNKTREQLVYDFAREIAGCKTKLTLQNMSSLINYNIIPEEYKTIKTTFIFNKYLKKNKKESFYVLDDIAQEYFNKNFDTDLLNFENGECFIGQKEWDKIYKKEMEKIRPFLSQPETLEKLNKALIEEKLDKYCEGNTSKWEMDSLGFYYGPHELEGISLTQYDVGNFFNLPEEPEVKTIMKFDDKEVPIYNLSRIAGTVIGKDKLKNIVTILTKEGVVKVKLYKPTFAKFDKTIFEKDENTGKKRIIERSWFTRGNKIIFTGIRRDDNFFLKKYKATPYPAIELITEIDYNNNRLKTISERAEV